ncbi:MAG TPA: DEAD/DEAH box helicase, partial [Actinomycetaceae bacterium]|nr:DEAD/DEAH box helicase [Actinomycetaceae bacterium]
MRESEILEVLRRLGAVDDRLVHLEQWPATDGATVAWPDWADPRVVEAYRTRGIDRPWQHQVRAAEQLWAGGHTVVATPTGSGKSLAAWLPALSAVGEARAAARGAGAGRISLYAAPPSTLYLAPTKALAADQLAGLEALLAAGGIGDVRVATCDGDTPTEERSWVRAHAHIVLTNPDFVHYSMLPGHRRWSRLLRGLRFIVIDESHAYRGVMGAHVSLVLRRLLRLAEQAGARPAVLLASATTGAPAASAARLLGVDATEVLAVTESTAPRGRRSLALWQPARVARSAAAGGAGPEEEDEWFIRPDPLEDRAAPEAPDDEPVLRRSALNEAADLLVEFARRKLRTLVFVRSRMAAEIVAEIARQRLAAEGAAAPVAAYRGGYLPEERRELERALRTGELAGLVTTNALELGVDIAGLDAVVIAGWPGTRVSLWQQAGRAGRAGGAGVAMLVASDNPLDAYVVHHPEAIVGQDVEATAFDPANPYVLAPHLCAAAAESPLRDEDLARFGLPDDALLRELAARGLLRQRPGGWYWNFARPESPASLTDLRGGTGRPVQVVEQATGAVVGTVDGQRADASVHPGAVYVHQGQHF